VSDGAARPPTVDVAVDGPVMTITLDRPHKLNAFTMRMMREMLAAFDRADADDDVRVVIVTGAGRAFCAGADLGSGGDSFDYETSPLAADVGTSTQEPAKSSEPVRVNGELRDPGGILTLRIFRCTKPVIAAINGPAVGVGATMTLPMDIRLASADARFGFVFAARGIVPEAASSWFLPRLVGIQTALEWCYTARIFPAAEALDAGLVRSLHPADQLLDAARSLALEIATSSAPVSVALTRMMMWRMLGASHPMEAHRVDSRGMNHAGRSADAAEGITAFFEKRPAQWTNRVSEDLPPFVPWWDEPDFE
jgi:enoyl-CoA hydratase/carnithine racemase